MAEQAKRVEPNHIDDQVICYWKDTDGLWWLYLPLCGAGVLSDHKVVENADKTITVTPSIVMDTHDGKQRHGYLTSGQWTEC